jgi:hypothetical protein
MTDSHEPGSGSVAHAAGSGMADDADPPLVDLPEFDIPEDPGVAECDLPQDHFGEFYLMLALSGHFVAGERT